MVSLSNHHRPFDKLRVSGNIIERGLLKDPGEATKGNRIRDDPTVTPAKSLTRCRTGPEPRGWELAYRSTEPLDSDPGFPRKRE